MPQTVNKETAAIRIQHWWRKHLKRKQYLIKRTKQIAEWRGLLDISLHNTELIQQLRNIRRRKAYDLMKYEHVLQLPARKVNEFLASEFEKPSKTVEDESEGILEKIELKKQNNAAIVIQRAFKSYHMKRISMRYLHNITHIRPKRRVELIERINERLSDRKSLYKTNLTIMKEKLAAYRAAREEDAMKFAERQLVIRSLKRDIKLLNSKYRTLPLVNFTIKMKKQEKIVGMGTCE
ncbi:hypothetical protein DICVIV_08065 [Dictyocaulus viviparus]|uniref:Uncharacterized protein n=1 Tax=Dictyocaulus viviparus TaxID=29172 RepID=A0A0D8XU22_DICVI|nr:hypothetical protein DICVIV_08065 [Dictyocaulus viviparus]